MTGRPHQLVRLLIIVLGAIAFHVGPGEGGAAAQTPRMSRTCGHNWTGDSRCCRFRTA